MNGNTCIADSHKPINVDDYFTLDLWLAGISSTIAKKKKTYRSCRIKKV